jgi:type II secretory pathway component PulF
MAYSPDDETERTDFPSSARHYWGLVVRVAAPFFMSLILIGWLTFGVSRYLRIFSDMGAEISPVSVVFLDLGRWATQYWFVPVLGAFLVSAVQIGLEVLTLDQKRKWAHWAGSSLLILFPVLVIVLGEFVLSRDIKALVEALS